MGDRSKSSRMTRKKQAQDLKDIPALQILREAAG